MEKEKLNGQMEKNTKEIIQMIKNMELEYLNGEMERNTMENGNMENNMVEE